ncbi:MAG: polysaccharide ABC transporter ATP-binding protein [Oscillospiraceae bacterium]|jgi:ABC-type polysaccharide/polyol phosphate transport system ATPase subunit
MENREIAIQLSGVRKMYKLGQIGGGTLQGDLQSWWARIRGREDPNTKIGSTQRLVGQTFMALNGIDLIVYKGEALGIIGGNGAGKSTMLKLLSRVTAPSAGEIDIYGRIASMLEVGTGFNGEMTGRENIYMNGAILGMTKAEIDAKMGNIVEFSEVGDFIDTPVKRYSSGMYVKLAFSVAAHLDSEIMIMDEVLAVGDMAFQKKCLDKMRDAANKQGRTVLYVSHNMNTIRQLCDRCIVLDKGKIVFDGDVEEAIEVYIGESSSTSSQYLYSAQDHTDKGSKSLTVKSLIMPHKGSSQIQPGEIVEILLKCEVRIPISNVKFRFEIQYADGTVVGTVMSGNDVDFPEAGICGVQLLFDTTHLVPGRYKADLVAYSTDDLGNDIYIDGIIPAMFFSICSYDDIADWPHKYWGHVRLHSMNISRNYPENQIISEGI